MKYLKLFEDYKLKSHKLYHGSYKKVKLSNKGGWAIPGSTFLAEDENVARGYGGYVYEVTLKDIKIFDTLNKEDVKELFNEFDILYDGYYNEDEEGHEITSVEQFMNLSDNWKAIEETDGVLDWIESQGYRAVRIIEGGSESNILLFYPKEDIISYKLI